MSWPASALVAYYNANYNAYYNVILVDTATARDR